MLNLKSRYAFWFLIGIFCLGLLPIASSFAIRYPDERFYIDGALFMVKDGDYMTPRWPDRSPRFQKPVLPYWLVAASYTTTGISILAARLPFLIAGCFTLWLTWKLARRLFEHPHVAILSVLILISHPQFILCSMRSMPDVLQAAFVLLSAYGFLRIMVFKETASGAYWAAYGGAALGFLSKGMLPVVFVLFAWGFHLIANRKTQSARVLVNIPAMLALLASIVAWFGFVRWAYGQGSLNVFVGDQVTQKVVSWWAPAYRAPAFVLVYIFNFLPWSLPAIEALIRKRTLIKPLTEEQKQMQRFAIGWALLIAIVFGFGKNISIRYMLPATPLIAICVAALIHRASESMKLVFTPARLNLIFLSLVLGVGGVAFAINRQLQPMSFSLGVLVLCVAVVVGLAVVAFNRKQAAPELSLAMSVFLLFPLVFISLERNVLPDSGAELAGKLSHITTSQKQPILVYKDLSLANRLRVFSQGQLETLKVDQLTPELLGRSAGVISTAKGTNELQAAGLKFEKVASVFEMPSTRRFFRAAISGELEKLKRDYTLDYYFATTTK